MVYKWRTVGFSANPNKVGAELETIEELTNYSVVDKARDKNTELHKCFEWDNSIAGEKYRLQQANHLLSSLSITVEENNEEKCVRKYVNVKTTEDKRVFKDIVKVVENNEEYIQLLDKAEREFIGYKQRYEELIKMKDLKDIIFRNI